MKLKLFIVIFISLLALSVVSGCFALAAYFLGLNHWAVFASAFGIISFLGWLYNISLEKRYRVTELEAIAENNLASAYSHVELVCAYCQVKNIVKIAVGKENSFKCKGCNSNNNIHIQYTTTRVTTPIMANPDLEKVLKDLEAEPAKTNQNSVNTDQLKLGI